MAKNQGVEFNYVSPYFKVQENTNHVLISGSLVDGKIKSYVDGVSDAKWTEGQPYELKEQPMLKENFRCIYLGYNKKENFYINDKGEILVDNSIDIRPV